MDKRFEYNLFAAQSLGEAMQCLNEVLQETKNVLDVQVEHIEKEKIEDGRIVTRLLVKFTLEPAATGRVKVIN